MQFRILGTLDAEVDGGPIDLGPPKQRSLLAVLLLHLNEVVPTERLVELVWGEGAPRTAAHSVQIYVSDLRKVLGPNRATILTKPPGYLLDADPDCVDACRFERGVDAALAAIAEGRLSAGADRLRAALELWRGPALSEFVYEQFAQSDIRRLEERRRLAIEELARVELDLGRGRLLIPHLDQLIGRDPLAEEPRRLHMLALYSAGRQADALRSFQTYRRLLGKELGIAPSRQLQLVEEQILLQDPSLPGSLPAAERAVSGGVIRNPYKGLRPFGEADAEDYFGRGPLVADLTRRLEEGQRLLVVTGPSGCGKSSLVRAGLVPAFRAGGSGWVVAQMMPGLRPFDELEKALHRVAPGGQRVALGEGDTALLAAVPKVLSSEGGRLLLVVDQFEELFALSGEEDRRQFLDTLVTALADSRRRMSVVVALRADFYDRPLLHPGFAALFVNSLVTLLPLSPSELQAAVVNPAGRVGVEVDPALLAELVAEMADQPGALPLLQYALTETFELREGPILGLDAYRRAGALKGALASRSEHAFQSLSGVEQEAAHQVLLRLVRLGHGADLGRRRVAVSELLGLDMDPVALGRVLEVFSANRLITLDRDLTSGAATVEVAHEALLREWPRLAASIERHRQDLLRHEALNLAVAEWEESGGDPDYLLSGGRLAQYGNWSQETTLRLTTGQRQYLDASLDLRRSHEAHEKARQEREHALKRVARGTFVGPPEAVLLWEGPLGTLHLMVEQGFDRAVTELRLTAEKVIPLNMAEDLERYAARGAGLVLAAMAPAYKADPCDVGSRFPKARFAFVEHLHPECENVTYYVFAREQGSFLVGAAAALRSAARKVGFVGGVDNPFNRTFLAGFEAGARHVDPTVEIESIFLSVPPDYSGWSSPALGELRSAGLYRGGVDIVFHAAGEAGWGVAAAARKVSKELGRHLWVIGVDYDQYHLAGLEERPHILTSALLPWENAAYMAVTDFARGRFEPGIHLLDLASGAVGYSTSGGFIDDLVPELEKLKADIIRGEIPPFWRRDAVSRPAVSAPDGGRSYRIGW
ncbi:MAG TPA: BTAD domain-containing putative transcriptional regulator [Acidimicrobiia bacterium]|nr:BTAD domain-containing putative transcriptional regulator [Acidimicrobiia bacterium]